MAFVMNTRIIITMSRSFGTKLLVGKTPLKERAWS